MEFPYFHHLSCEGLPGVLGIREHDHLFQGNKGHFFIKWNFDKTFWGMMEFINREQGRKSEIFKGTRECAPPDPPWEALPFGC